MLPKLIAVDMDGTFLTDQKDYNRQRFAKIFTELSARGSRFVVASGNQIFQLRSFFVQPEVLYLAENGAYCATADKKLFAHTFDPEVARSVLDALMAIPELRLTICGEHSAYIRAQEGPAFIAETQAYYHRLKPVANFDVMPNDAVLKFASNFPPELTTAMLDRIQIAVGTMAEPTSSGHGDIDIIQPGVNKARGLRELGAHLGIDLADMAAFGDGGNDLEMLEAVGLGVAMQNADAAVKAIADDQTLDNNHDGVLAYLEQLLAKN